MRPPLLALALVALLPACAAHGAANRPAPRNRDVLDAEEIAAARVTNAYDAITMLRPRFFASRGKGSFRLLDGGVIVLLDSRRLSVPSELRNVNASDIDYVRLVGPSEATMYWGTGFTDAVVYVKTRAAGDVIPRPASLPPPTP